MYFKKNTKTSMANKLWFSYPNQLCPSQYDGQSEKRNVNYKKESEM